MSDAAQPAGAVEPAGAATAPTPAPAPGVDLPGLLELEYVEQNLFRANVVFSEEYSLYGGQVAAQALMAAGRTVDRDREPHSLHGYFLRPGDPQRPTVFKVHCDRDGRSFSARRVVAIQRGKVIFNMSASFQVPQPDAELSQTVPMPDTPRPEDCAPGNLHRLFSITSRFPPQPYASRTPWPTRFWSRVVPSLELSGPESAARSALVHACALTYLSDISTGILPAADGSAGPGPSVDHAVWFHDRADMNEWTLCDYQPRVAGRGRGWYTGALFAQDGRLVASMAQECLYRPRRVPSGGATSAGEDGFGPSERG